MSSSNYESAITRLRHITSFVSSNYESIAGKLSLNPVQFEVLLYISENSPCGVTAVAEHFLLGKATISRIVDRLEGDGWVVLKKDTEDKRRTLIMGNFTPENILKLRPIVEEWLEVDKLAYVIFGDAIRNFEKVISEQR